MGAYNATTGVVLAKNLIVADNFWKRLKGLIGKRELIPDSALYLVPCNGIHTLGMSFPIDVLYLDDQLKVVHVIQNMKPYQRGPMLLSARSVLELPANTLKHANTRENDLIELEGIKCSTNF